MDTGDGQRGRSLIERAESCLSEPLPSLPGAAILHAYMNDHRNIAKDLIAQCTSEQIAAAPPNLLRLVAERLDFQTAMELVDKGVPVSAMAEAGLFDKLVKVKYEIPNDKPEMFGEYNKELDDMCAQLLAKQTPAAG